MSARYGIQLVAALVVLACGGCDSARDDTQFEPVTDPYALPSSVGDAIMVVVEIPAGTNRKFEYHPDEGYVNDTLTTGDPRVIQFLPYPGNYGFVPSTLMDSDRGGDGDPLDVLVIGESLPTGDTISALPIGTLQLLDGGEIDTKIIAVPRNPALRMLHAEDFIEFSLEHDAAKRIIELWFLNYKGAGTTQLIRWEDERYAWQEVRKWSLK